MGVGGGGCGRDHKRGDGGEEERRGEGGGKGEESREREMG